MTRFDLHVHTALSACAEDVMSPRQVLDKAATMGLHMIAVTDHNASRHVAVARRLADAFGLIVVGGMEIMTREEVHLLALFDNSDGLDELQCVVDENLPRARNDNDMFGYQLVYDENDEIVDVDEQLRQVAVGLGIDRVADIVHRCGGVAVPAHIDRAKNSLTSQLGFVDPDGSYDALEVTWRTWLRDHHHIGDRHTGFRLITNSDAHFLEDIGRSCLDCPTETSSVRELLEAL